MKILSLTRSQLLKGSSVVLILLSAYLGWTAKGIYLDIQALTCNDFSTKHAVWKGFLSTKNGEMRCFWLEDKYPWRVKQGVTE